MKQIKIGGRIWNTEGGTEVLLPWAEQLNHLPATPIKQNKNRSVWKLQTENGEFCFLKVEQKFQFPFFPSKAEREFRAYKLLAENGIPCAEYSAWSATRNDCMIVSRALPESFRSVLEYWYRLPQPSESFLQVLCELIAKLCHAGIFHPDFHLGNLMTDGKQIVLLDPVGIRKTRRGKSPGKEMLAPLNEMIGDFPAECIGEHLLQAGLFSGMPEALAALEEVSRAKQERIDREWERRKQQIKSGSSKFATEISPGKMQRNSAWFSRFDVPENAVLKEYEYSLEEGEKVWLSSFESQLRKRPLTEIPVFYEISSPKSKITVLSDKKYSFFYGFR